MLASDHLSSSLHKNTQLSGVPDHPNSTPNHVKLFSNLAEISGFLHIQLPPILCHQNEYFEHISCPVGQRIYTVTQKFETLYLVNSGFLKTVLFDEFGHEQILNFPMKGDILGIDSLHSECHCSEAVTLSDCNLIVLPYRKLLELSHDYIQIEEALMKFISKELAQQQARLTMLGKTSAEARVAQFLVLLSEKFSLLGYSKNEFNLRMTRNEIGSYLGMTLETVSRIFSLLNELGIVSVHQKKICIHNLDNLKKLYAVTKSHLRQIC